MIVLFMSFIVSMCALLQRTTALENPLSDEFINLINSKQNSWTAGRNFPLHTSMKYIKKLIGTLKDDNFAKLQKLEHDAELMTVLPKNFDPREKWPNCPSLNEIRDQGSCASCWALGAVEAMTDRYCIYSNGTKQFHFSAEDLISCCETCGLGCIRGVHTAAWAYWKRVGLVSGGNYNSNQGCKPYKIAPGVNSSPSRRIVDISDCVTSCDSSYSIDYYKDKRRGKIVYSIDSDEEQIKAELFKNGPVEAVMAVYTDYLNYKSGVYSHAEGYLLGHHAVKILGWGEEHGRKYWFVANSWNQEWGDQGFFKILRGVNHCGIEDSIVAGEPLIV
ncbi:hypothetical protein PYW07_017097 [Mythimna separata]|uniref:Peptidase C1A papain C-terminal domain-containing protein n=1 Tax=Mythimna separata TaxID=271217 RepID=A0AAD7YXB8_MYTSE|nr:hypothetical protein PYW07_017097 [Mythimna separata]